MANAGAINANQGTHAYTIRSRLDSPRLDLVRVNVSLGLSLVSFFHVNFGSLPLAWLCPVGPRSIVGLTQR
jgi:hypothetical protein